MKNIFKYFTFIILFCLIAVLQYLFDSAKEKASLVSPFVPDAGVVKAANLGLDSATSSLYWLLAIQYFGAPQTDGYQKFDDYIDLATDLDPKFSHPYAFATLVMPPQNLTEEAIIIAKKGVEKAETKWEIAYNLGLVYHMHKEDSKNAAKYFDIAGQDPKAPENIKWIAANYGSRPDIREQTKLIWQGIAESTNDPLLKERALAYIYHFELMSFLEAQATEYKTRFGDYPERIEQLVEKNILTKIPEDPFGYSFIIDSDGRARIVIPQNKK
jgi:hypothetical protein